MPEDKEPSLLFSGTPRSGKSTIARRVAEATGLLYFSPGQKLKEMAEDQNQPFHEYFARLSPSVLNQLSTIALDFINDGGYIIDGRYEPVICRRAGIFVPAVYVTADIDVRAERFAAMENISFERAKEILLFRQKSELTFSRRIFGVDYNNEEFYRPPDSDEEPMIIDTTSLNPDEAYEATISLLREKGFLRTPGD